MKTTLDALDAFHVESALVDAEMCAVVYLKSLWHARSPGAPDLTRFPLSCLESIHVGMTAAGIAPRYDSEGFLIEPAKRAA